MKKQKLVIRIIAIVTAVLLAVSLLWPLVSSTVYGETLSGAAPLSARYEDDAVLAENGIAFTDAAALSTAAGDGYGELLADAYLYAARECGAVGADENAMGIISVGSIGGTLPTGSVTAADARGAIAKSGDGGELPLVLFYVSARDLKHLAELDVSVSQNDPASQFFFSGVSFVCNPNRMLFDRVTDLAFVHGGMEYWPDDNAVFPVVTDLATANELVAAEGEANRMISFSPLDKSGAEITDFGACVLSYDGAELPAWRAVAAYLVSFGGSVPESYAASDGRKTLNDDSGVGAIISSPGKATWMAIGLTAAICALLGLLAVKFIVGNLNKLDDGGPDNRLR